MESTGKVLVPPAGSLSPPATTTYKSRVQTVGDGEKPRIWWCRISKEWCCWLDEDWEIPEGWGPTPQEAYQDWCLGMLTYEAQEQGLYGEAPATRKESP